MAPGLGPAVALAEWRRRLVFWGGAIAVGAVAVLFAKASDAAMHLFTDMRSSLPWWPWVAAPAGLAFSAWLTLRVFIGAEGSGIPQTIAALSLPTEQARDRLLSVRIATGKILLTVLALACGASIGREGPTVQVGAAIMHSLRRYARFAAADVDRGLILAGGAAGVAAAFNTPLAGVVFAIEELWRSFEPRTSATILAAVIIAGVTSVAVLGNYTYFGSTNAVMSDARTWLAVPFCGLVGGLAGGLFSRALVGLGAGLPGALQSLRDRRPIAFAAACGVLIAALGWISAGTTYGTGYGEAKLLLQNEALPSMGFALFKALATLVSYVSARLVAGRSRRSDGHPRHGRILLRRRPGAVDRSRDRDGNDRQPCLDAADHGRRADRPRRERARLPPIPVSLARRALPAGAVGTVLAQ